MKTNYRFITDSEPSDAELAEIMFGATESAIEKAEIAKKQLLENLNKYLKSTKEKYAKRIVVNEATT